MKNIQEILDFSVINIDKPIGPTSFSVTNLIRRLLNLKKSAHFGTLDPAVGGVLPIALNRACRLNEYFMHRDKKYIGIMRVHSEISGDKLKEEIKEFIGKIKQLPPKKSRVKRAIREREIKEFDVLERDGKDFLFITEVQAGTYIRKLIHDLGENIGGAHMLELRRTQAGIFTEDKSHNLYELEEAVKFWKEGDETKLRKMLIPAEEALKSIMPFIEIKEESLKGLLIGRPLMEKDIGKINLDDGEKFAVYLREKFIGVYRKVNEDNIIGRAEFVLN